MIRIWHENSQKDFKPLLIEKSLKGNLEDLDACGVHSVTTEEFLMSSLHVSKARRERVIVAKVEVNHAVLLETHVTPNDDLATLVVINGVSSVVLSLELQASGKGENEGLGIWLVASWGAFKAASCVTTENVACGALVNSKDVALSKDLLSCNTWIASV